MSTLLYILVGGGFGSVSRYLLSNYIQKFATSLFPIGTLGVNTLGGVFIGILWAFVEMSNLPREIRFFAITGFLGGFTTFSTFSLESMNLLREGEYYNFAIYVVLNNAFSIIGTIIAFLSTRWLLQNIKFG